MHVLLNAANDAITLGSGLAGYLLGGGTIHIRIGRFSIKVRRQGRRSQAR